MNRTLTKAMEFALRSAYVIICDNNNSTSITQNYPVLSQFSILDTHCLTCGEPLSECAHYWKHH